MFARLRAAAARTDFAAFKEHVLKDETGRPVELGEIHHTWDRHIFWCWGHGLHPGILSLWRHGKSTQIAIGLVLWMIGRDPNIRVKIVCNSEDEAVKRVDLIGKYLKDSQRYREVFPNVMPDLDAGWTAHHLFVQRAGMSPDPTVEAKGVMTTGIGGGADLLIFDDPVDQKNSVEMPGLRVRVLEYIQGTWMSRLGPRGRLAYIGTAWHQLDASHELMKNPRFSFLIQRVSPDFGRIDSEVILHRSNLPDGGQDGLAGETT